MKTFRLVTIVLLTLLCLNILQAENNEFDPETAIKIEQYVEKSDLKPGDPLSLAILFIVPPGYHITDSDLFFVRPDSQSVYKFDKPVYPPKVKHKDIDCYRDTVKVMLKGFFPDQVKAEQLTVGYQICTETGDESCFFPVEKSLEMDITKAKPELFTQASVPAATAQPVKTAKAANEEDAMAGQIMNLEKGSVWVFIFAFFGGILDSFTPCVYPIIPIVISYMGSRSTGKKKAGFILSLFFVVGLAITYSVVGTVVAFLGGLVGIGDIAFNPWVLGTVATIFLALSLSMFGLWDMNFVSADKKSGWMQKDFSGVMGAVVLGMISGVIAAPCVGPVLAALLIHVATVGDWFYGWLVLLCFAFGLGLLFLVIGTFSGAINALPRAGAWMVNIKKFFGIMMVGAAIYFLHFLFPGWLTYGIIGFFLILLAVFMGAFSKIDDETTTPQYFGKAIGIVALVAGSIYIISCLGNFITLPFAGAATQISEKQAAPEEVEFIIAKKDSMIVTDAFAKAAAENKIIMMDFWATWCPNCIELDKTVWNQPEVKALAHEKFVPVKIDLTDNDDFAAWIKNKYKDYGANNPPLILFIKPDGTVIGQSRGLVEKEVMLERMEEALKQ